ncbi:Y-family DNA polymerase [Achromobacter aloeverae]|uniref:Y-family DNA polymerase n=1 Tax=Achromobacter aloeverae TaxID=1750518 RepID=UPI001F011CDC|nr:DNA polymerase Y family protein [Achromobacter aloeverae]
MPLWIAVSLPRLALDALRPPWPLESTACAVMQQDRVLALTTAAADLGIQPGLRRGGVTAIAPQVIMLERDVAAEEEARQATALALLQYTPEVALADADTILLGVGASLRAFGGARRLLRRVRATVASQDLRAVLAMAPTAGGAWLLAQSPARRRRVLRLDALTRRLDALPCRLLPQARPHLDWLRGIGCQTLRQLRALPRAGLQRRCGPDLVLALDRAYGQAPQVHAWLTAPAQFRRRHELIERIEHTDAVLAVAGRLLEPLCGWLTARQLAVPRLRLALEHERGRHARPPTPLDLALAEPAWQADHLRTLLRERLARLVLEAPVIAVVLDASDTVPRPGANTTLFPDPAQQAGDQARLLDVLAARLGRDRVRVPCPTADHRPEAANRWRQAHDAAGAAGPAPALDRPYWLLDPPHVLRVRDQRPFHGSPLTLVRGPERIESGWWDGDLALRDYFVAEDAAGARYWIYRERDGQEGRWFLHGLFG